MSESPAGRLSLTRRIATSVAAVAVTATTVFTGVNAAFASISTDRGSAVSLASIGSLDAAGIMPGEQVERVVAIMVPAGEQSVLSVSAETSSILDQDTSRGLQLHGELCSSQWVRLAERFACSGTITTALAPRPIAGVAPLSLGLQPLGGQLMRLTVSLPATAGSDFMGQASTLTYRIGA